MSNVFGKVTIVAGVQQILDVGGSGLSGVLVANESGLTCTVEMQGANIKRSLYAGTVDFFPVAKGVNWTGNLIIAPSADLNNISFWPSSFVQIDTFGLGEAPHGTYPMNLNRTGNVGNQVTTTVGSSTSVQNDNNAAGTEFIEATVLGSPSSNEAHFNDGSGWIGRWNNPTFTKVLQWFSAGATALQLGAASFLTEVLGNLKVDGNETVVGTGSWNAAGATIDGASAFNGSAVNVTTANVGTVNAGTINDTTINTATLSATSNILEANNQAMQWKDSGGTARNVLNVDASNNVNIQGITGKDILQFLASGGGVTGLWDFVNKSLDIRTTAVILAGTTAGTAELYMPFTGSNFKLMILFFNGYRNASGVSQNINLPVAFAQYAVWLTSNGKAITPRSGGVNLVNKVNVVTALAAGGGTRTNQSQIPSSEFGELFQTFDGFDLGNGHATNSTAVYFFVGL